MVSQRLYAATITIRLNIDSENDRDVSSGFILKSKNTKLHGQGKNEKRLNTNVNAVEGK
jgi:hypothetical protein